VKETSLAVVTRFGDAVSTGNLDEVRRLLDEDVVVHEAGGLPYSGDYHGPQGFIDLLTTMTEVFELTPGPIDRTPLDDDTVVCRFRLRFTVRGSGRSVEMNLVELYRVRQGRIVDLDVYYKDPSAVTDLLAV
jgi:ketosteroid isomerase-like protein